VLEHAKWSILPNGNFREIVSLAGEGNFAFLNREFPVALATLYIQNSMYRYTELQTFKTDIIRQKSFKKLLKFTNWLSRQNNVSHIDCFLFVCWRESTTNHIQTENFDGNKSLSDQTRQEK